MRLHELHGLLKTWKSVGSGVGDVQWPVMDVPVPLEDFPLLKEVKVLMECSPQHPVGREVINTSLGAQSYEDPYESSDDSNDGPLEEQMDVEDLLQELDGYSE